MIVLDTNVVSETLKLAPSPIVVDWLNRQARETLYLTTVTLAELLAGVELVPAGRRRNKLKQALTERLIPLFDGRVLSFDPPAAVAFASLNARAQTAGSPISFADCAIASIASAHAFAVATRNVRDFKSVEIELINPWVGE